VSTLRSLAQNGAQACDHNFGAACYNVAFMYKNGDGVEPDMKKAEFYWQVRE